MSYKIKPFEELEFKDDFIFYKVMQNQEACKGVIERLLSIKVDHIEYPELQKTIMPYYTAKGVRLDVYVKDSDKVFNVEMQANPLSDPGLRARYYQSMIDVDCLMKGASYDELPDSYILFICLEDPFEEGLPVYTFENVCEECPELVLDDGTKKIFYNAGSADKEENEELRALLNFVGSSESTDNFTERLQDLITQIKQREANKTEYIEMNIHDYDKMREGKLEVAENMLAENFPIEQIVKLTGLSVEEIEKIKSERNA